MDDGEIMVQFPKGVKMALERVATAKKDTFNI
jgi:hypothetical protein